MLSPLERNIIKQRQEITLKLKIGKFNESHPTNHTLS